METLVLKGSSRNPHITFNGQERTIVIKGNSIPEDSRLFLTSLTSKVEQLLAEIEQPITVAVQFDYLNSSSYKVFLEFFKTLASSKQITFEWSYSDEDEVFEFGKICQQTTGAHFSFVSLN